MSKLYLVKDGIKGVGCITVKDEQIFNTNFYLITYDFRTNEGYISKKKYNHWRLYTQIGQKVGQSRYHELSNFEECLEQLKELKGDDDIIICQTKDIEKYK